MPRTGGPPSPLPLPLPLPLGSTASGLAEPSLTLGWAASDLAGPSLTPLNQGTTDFLLFAC